MFLENKYTKYYFIIISHAKKRASFDGYGEVHHIVPKSLGGDNTGENLVKLTAREHFVVHRLLVRMVEKRKHKELMFYAMWNMLVCSKPQQHRYITSSRTYERIRKEFSIFTSEKHSKHRWWNNGLDQVFTVVPPDINYKKGRLPFNNVGAAIGAKIQSNKHWVNDGTVQMMVDKSFIPEGFVKGRYSVEKFGPKSEMKTKGSHWWNDGIIAVQSKEKPGEKFSLGRKLKSLQSG